jgi:hypothetical protein
MSDLVIKDGTGSGYRAKVDLKHRVSVTGTVQPEIFTSSTEDGQAYALPVNDISVPSTEAAVFYMQSTDPVNNFHVHKIVVGWNGGSTTHIKTLIGRFYVSMATPTANNAVITPVNLNMTSTNVPAATLYKWNGTGTGMTVASNGALAFSTYAGIGNSVFEFDGAFIMGFNKIIGITLQGEEAGLASIQFIGWNATAGS